MKTSPKKLAGATALALSALVGSWLGYLVLGGIMRGPGDSSGVFAGTAMGACLGLLVGMATRKPPATH